MEVRTNVFSAGVKLIDGCLLIAGYRRNNFPRIR